MRRFLLTCAIGLGLWAALLAYSQVMTPLTRARERPRQPPKMTGVANQPVVLDPAISNSLNDQEWIKSAKLQWQRSKQAYLYAGQVEPDANSDGTSLKMSPFALVWKDEKSPDRPPMTIVARSARVRFEKTVFDTKSASEPDDISSFNLVGQDAGRIVAAFLDGEVRITGPDNLVIDGQNFIFREETAQLYSDYEISFRYGPPDHGEPVALQGKSLDGLTISFNPAPNAPLGSDMPRIEERPRSAQLVGRVSVDFVTQEAGQATPTRVSSQGPFTYEFASNTAKFSDRVLVTRPRQGRHRQELECNWLALVFSQIADEQTPDGVIPAAAEEVNTDNSRGLLSRMELVTVRAMAKSSPNSPQRDRMKLTSTEHGLVCELDDMNYDAKRQLLTLTDPGTVDVTRELDGHTQRFEAPTIEIRHRDRQLDQISGMGKGRFTYRSHPDPKEIPDVWARWTERLDLIPQPHQGTTELTIRGAATIRHRDQMQFSASTITAWLLPLEQLGSGLANSSSKLPRKARPPRESPVQRVVASGNVVFAGPGIVGRQIQQVDIQVVSGPIISVSEPRRRRSESAAVKSASQNDAEEIPFVFETTRLEGVAVFDPAVNEYGIQELHGFEGVKLWREELQSGEAEIPFEKQPVRVTSREFSAVNSGGTRQVLTLRGVVDPKGAVREPVIAKFGDFSVEGPNLVVDREKNLITIDGQGVLRFPVDQDFSGKPLSPPQLADIAFAEKAEFDGQKATCWGGVKASVLTNIIWAEQMNAVLNQRIDFSADEPRTQGFGIDSLHCQDKVRVKFYEYSGDNVVEVMNANLHDFDLNQNTGDFVGTGPGKIQDWRRSGTRRMMMQPNTSARANRPADTNREYEWEYVGIEFKDKLTGNVKQQWGKLNERVKLIYAPVKTAYEVFEMNDLSSDSKNAASAVWIGSDQLTVTIAEQPGMGAMATVEAVHNAEMEGQLFYARAHSLQYEQAKEMFTLRGKGQDDATLNIYREKDGTASKLPAQMIQFFPSRQEVVIDRAKTFSAVFGGDSSGK